MSKISIFQKWVVELGKLHASEEEKSDKKNPLPIHPSPQTTPWKEKPFFGGKKKETRMCMHTYTHTCMCVLTQLYCRLM